jgi:hypothetical protein
VLREAIMCCRKGGTLSMPGVYVGFARQDADRGAAMNKGLTFKMGQTHVQRYLKPLLAKIEAGEIDPSFVITHRCRWRTRRPRTRRSATSRTAASRSCCGRDGGGAARSDERAGEDRPRARALDGVSSQLRGRNRRSVESGGIRAGGELTRGSGVIDCPMDRSTRRAASAAGARR